MDSFIFLARLCPSLPIIWKLFWLVVWQTIKKSLKMIAQIAILAANTVVEVILERRHEDGSTRHRGDIKGLGHRHNGCSPVYSYADQVNNSLHTSNIYKPKTKDISEAKNIRDKQNTQKDNEDINQTIKSYS